MGSPSARQPASESSGSAGACERVQATMNGPAAEAGVVEAGQAGTVLAEGPTQKITPAERLSGAAGATIPPGSLSCS